MVVYLDSSAVLRHILLGSHDIDKALSAGKLFSSELLEIECRRVIHRCRMQGELSDEQLLTAIDRLERLLRSINLIALNGAIKKRAMESFPVVIKTLDALHLSSALTLQGRFPDDPVHLFSHDRAMNLCGRALGFQTPLL